MKMGKWTVCKGDVFCPNCGKTGQLKQFKPRIGTLYWRVDHYVKHRRIGGFHGKWSNSCYLGKHILLDGKSTVYVIDHDIIVPPFNLNRILYPHGVL